MEPKKKSKTGSIVAAAIALIAIAFLSLHGAQAFKMMEVGGSGRSGLEALPEYIGFLQGSVGKPLSITVNEYTRNFALVGGLALLMAIAVLTNGKKKFIKGKEHGTARWGTAADIAPLREAATKRRELAEAKGKDKSKKKNQIIRKYSGKNSETLLTASEAICIWTRRNVNNNVLVVGGSGAGKTRGFVVPNILQANTSFVVTDPKGEILENTGSFLRANGYVIRVLNLAQKSRSDRYNPFAYIHPEREGYEEAVGTLVTAIISNTDGGEKRNSSDPFWERAEEMLLKALFFFVADGFPEEERNMQTVAQLVEMLEIKAERDNRDSDLDYFCQVFEKYHGANHIGVKLYKEFRKDAEGKTGLSVLITAVTRLAKFWTSSISKMFSDDDFQLDMLGERKTAVFVVVPPTDSTYSFVSGMLFTQMFQELEYCATTTHRKEGQRLPVPVRFILDEFANTCRIPNFTAILAYARSFGISICPIIQSLEQIKKIYEKDWGTLLDNCSALLFLGGVKNSETLEYMSKLLGKGTFDKKTTGRTKGRQGSSSQNFDVIGRDLLDAAEVGKIPPDRCILIITGLHPFYSKKYRMESHPHYDRTSSANPANSYDHETKAEMEKRRAAFAAPTMLAKSVAPAEEQEQEQARGQEPQAEAPEYPEEEAITIESDPQRLLALLADADGLISAGSATGAEIAALRYKLTEAMSMTEQMLEAEMGEVITDPVRLAAFARDAGKNLAPADGEYMDEEERGEIVRFIIESDAAEEDEEAMFIQLADVIAGFDDEDAAEGEEGGERW